MEQFTLTIPSRDEEARGLIARAIMFFSEKKKEGLARAVDDYIFRLAHDIDLIPGIRYGKRIETGSFITYSYFNMLFVHNNFHVNNSIINNHVSVDYCVG